MDQNNKGLLKGFVISNNNENWTADDEDVEEYDEESEDLDGEDDNDGSDSFLYGEDFSSMAKYKALKEELLMEVGLALQTHSEVNCTNALALNKLMQDKLSTMRSKLLDLLKRLKLRYVENEEKLRQGVKRKPRRGIGIRGAYLKGSTFYFKGNMFFKDVNCRNCPNNPDYIYRSEVEGEVFPMDFELRGRHVWAMSDKVSIVQGIKEQVIEYLENRNNTSRKLELNTNIEKLEKQIALHTQKLGNLLENVDNNFNIDWNLISVHNLKYRHSAYSANAMWNVYLHPSLRRGCWSAEENDKLLEAVKEHNYEDWQSIAEQLGSRSDYQCFVQFHNTVCFLVGKKFSKWTKAENKRLLDLVNTYTVHGVINWNAVASRFPNRTKMKCTSRYYYSLDPKISHGQFKLKPFTPQEDLVLLAAVEEYGENFACIPRTLFPNRSTAQLRGRYRNTLINRNKVNGWSPEDDKKLMDFVAEYGPSSWRKCADTLGNHTRTSCRTRFLTIKKFLEKYPNAAIEDIPTKMRGADNVITTVNWTEKIAELRNDPNLCLLRTRKRRKQRIRGASKSGASKDPAPETAIKESKKTVKEANKSITYAQKLRAIEFKMYQFFKYAYNYKLGIDPYIRTPIKPKSLKLVQCACRFHELLRLPFIEKSTLPYNIAKICKIMLSHQQKCNSLKKKALSGYRLPPSWATLMGFRALCIQSSQPPPAKQKPLTAKTKDVEALQLFRERLRVIFYNTGLLSRLNPENIANIHTRNESQITAMAELFKRTYQPRNPNEALLDFISKAKRNQQIKKAKRKKCNNIGGHEIKKLKISKKGNNTEDATQKKVRMKIKDEDKKCEKYLLHHY